MASAPRAPAPKLPEIKVGDVVLDRYRVDEQIGTGGHSLVFKGTDQRLQRPVCIKIFSGLGGDSGVGRTSYEHFVQEAFALSRLTHPNTLRIYDFGHLGPNDAAGNPLQVCEYMNGGTLSNVIREQGKQSLDETVRVIGAMCAALSEAHHLGIVHRDIKPQNILFGSVGQNRLPKLADFGIAKWSAENQPSNDQRAEDTAIVAGQKLAMYSPSWAAPEQLAGQPVSPATDIYSLACVTIYMLSGKAIFAEEDVYAGYKKRRQADQLVREALGPLNLPRQVIDVMVRALAFDPKKRLDKVDELSAELAEALEPQTEQQPKQKSATKPMPSEMITPTTPIERYSPPAPPPAPPAVAPSTYPVVSMPHDYPVVRPSSYPNADHPVTPSTPHPVAQTPRTKLPGVTDARPTPPLIPAVDPTPSTFHAPASSQAWMHSTPPVEPTALARWLGLLDVPQLVGDRRVHFVMLANNTADLAGSHGTKLRITLMPGPTGQRLVHVKGLSCFVAIMGGRPSGAVQVDRSSDIALVTPRAQEIGHLRIAQGSANSNNQTVFQVGSELVAVGIDDCADAILFDFGPGADAYFVYTRGRPVPKTSSRRG